MFKMMNLLSAQVVKLVDTPDLGSGAARCVGSSPILGIISHMKPKDLKNPFNWDQRKPAITDNVLFVPNHYTRHQEFTFPPFQKIFNNSNPIHIEYCSGNGEWIIARAEQNPHINWVAVEKQFPRVRKIWSKSQNRQLKNLFIICGEALTFTQNYIQKPTFSAFYVNFPDPWPKTRHAKHRLICEPFATEIARCALPSSTATFVTDDYPYATQMLEVMTVHPNWQNPTRTILGEGTGESFFDRLWRSKGRQIHQITSMCN